MQKIKISGKLVGIESDVNGWTTAIYEQDGFKMESGESSSATQPAKAAAQASTPKSYSEVVREAKAELDKQPKPPQQRVVFKFAEDKRDKFDSRNPNPVKSCIPTDGAA